MKTHKYGTKKATEAATTALTRLNHWSPSSEKKIQCELAAGLCDESNFTFSFDFDF